MGADMTRRTVLLVFFFFLALVAQNAVIGASEKTAKDTVDCPEPACAKDCKTKVGDDGCLVCDCRGDCPLLVCGPGCHEVKNETEKCPECVCEGEERFGIGGQPPEKRHCPELTCPPECEKETVTPTHRCPWCLCPSITSRETLEKHGERHCPRALLNMVFRQADPLARHVIHFQEQVHHQDTAVQHLLASTGKPGEQPAKAECVPPKCDGKGCELVPGDQGCPRCVCTPEAGHKKKGNKTKAPKAHVVKRNTTAKKESSEESSESNSKESHERTQRGRRDSLKVNHKEAHKHEHKHEHNHGNHTTTHAEGTERRHHPPHAAVQCVIPVCEPYCKFRQAEHGCLVCECPDVCPHLVCGAGCQPYYTEASKCERCLCGPHTRREPLAEVFSSFCSEHTLHRMLADFDDFRDSLVRLQHRSLELDQLINRVEHARGIHGPVPEEVRASFGLHHPNHHQPLHHQAGHHLKHPNGHHSKPAEKHHN